MDAATVARHGMSPDEYALAVKALGREPNLVELGVFSVMWSEHCSYKSSRRLLKGLPTTGPRVLQGPGENAGVVDLGDGLAVAFKMESHNHPSYIEPYQGAATGVGGILRDVFTMGARPIASLNLLRFGEPSHPRTGYLLGGVVAGIGGYGNAIGVPTVGGEIAFDASFNGNCLVNAFTAGVLPSGRIFRGSAVGVGNPVLYVGARTGRDGIHGATMASAEFGEGSEEKRPTVQVGDPFTEKLLLEACLELMQSDAVVGIQDMGAAGLTSSSVEMAGRAGNGLRLHLDRIPMRESGMTPYELLLSESQERMLLVAARGREGDVLSIFRKWDLEAAVVGEVTDTGRLEALWNGTVAADVPIAPLTEGAPSYERPRARPKDLEQRWQLDPTTLPSAPVAERLLQLLRRPTIASKEWAYRQYDHQVRLGGVVLPGGDAAVVRIEGGTKGLGLSADCNSRFCQLDPYEGARLAVAECCRNLAAVGAEPIGLTDCLNFGSPEKPEIMWQLAEAIRGIGDACRALDVPVVSGNVSLYNETDGKAIQPTPAVAVVGLVEDCGRTTTSWFRRSGDKVALLGEAWRGAPELGGSELLAAGGQLAGRPPRLDTDLEKSVQRACRAMIRARLLSSAHDCSEGGLGVALAECCMMGPEELRLGASVKLVVPGRADLALFSEEPSRIVISFAPNVEAQVRAAAKEAGAPLDILGDVGGDELAIEGVGRVPVTTLSEAWRGGLPAVLG
ncbi:MAG TPA: phosphoribosylformylglycinamidine synthase subunit PurL [Myxococcales bacterium]|nr:phosphoribosylformylglycinamidine synthase subunit PurL [Myxococcales bacterium]